MIKNIAKATAATNLFAKKIFSKKKKKAPTNTFIINMRPRLAGGIVKANKTNDPKINIKNIDFFQYFPVACNIVFNYNRNLWLK